MTKAIDLLRKSFGVGQLYKHEVTKDENVLFTVYWHPLTIAEREAIQVKGNGNDDGNEFALNLMIEKALDENEKRLFQDGDKPTLRREVEASILQEIQLAMLSSGTDMEVDEAKADLKS